LSPAARARRRRRAAPQREQHCRLAAAAMLEPLHTLVSFLPVFAVAAFLAWQCVCSRRAARAARLAAHGGGGRGRGARD
jgi:hypothetical protein